jgi:hypothetical protein
VVVYYHINLFFKVDVFLDVNQNKSMESYEQMEPMHLNYERNSESEYVSGKSTPNIKDPRIDEYLRQQLDTTVEGENFWIDSKMYTK